MLESIHYHLLFCFVSCIYCLFHYLFSYVCGFGFTAKPHFWLSRSEVFLKFHFWNLMSRWWPLFLEDHHYLSYKMWIRLWMKQRYLSPWYLTQTSDYRRKVRKLGVNPLHPNISMHIHHTILSTFPKVLARRICLPIKSFFRRWSFPLFSWP